MNTLIESTARGDARPAIAEIPVDFKAVLCAMHERQALTHEESSAHWRRVAVRQLESDNPVAASFALQMSDQLAEWAREEWASAGKLGGALDRKVTWDTQAGVLADRNQQSVATRN